MKAPSVVLVSRAVALTAAFSLLPLAITLSGSGGKPVIEVELNDGCAQGGCCYEPFALCSGEIAHEYNPLPDGCSQ